MTGFKFPLFIDVIDTLCVVVGAGAVGMRRVRTLTSFGARVRVVDPAPADNAVRELSGMRGVELVCRVWEPGDVDGARLVSASTNAREVNAAVAAVCCERGIPVSVADSADESTFFFPAVCRSNNLVAGVVSRGTEHRLTARAARAVRETLARTDSFGDGSQMSQTGCLAENDSFEARPQMSHMVALVGAGPGDPGLMTVRGLDLLERADIVVHDHLVGPEVLARAGIRNAVGHARLINVGKHAGDHPVPQDEINRILVRESTRAGLVVRLKGGDPYVFGRGGEEASYLQETGVAFEVVPGVTSALAALSYAGVPITDRRAAASFHVVTGHRRADAPDGLGIDFDALVRAGGTLVFLMAVGTMGRIADGLLAAGMDGSMPACLVENGTLPAQRRIDGTLATIEERGRAACVKSPAILVVGAACALAPQLDWFDRRSLHGRTIAVTRPRGRADELVRMLRELGADVLESPLIETVPRPHDELAATVRDLGRYSWIAFTSAEGVRCLGLALDAAGLDARALAGTRLAAVGPATARALRGIGLRADLMPEVYDTAHLARALAEAVRRADVAGGDGGAAGSGGGVGAAGAARVEAAPILLFRSAQGSADLPRILGDAGVAFDDIAAYDTRAVPTADPGVRALVEGVRDGRVDAVTLTSSSGARALADAMGLGRQDGSAVSWPASCRVVCLGAATRKAAESFGLRPCAEALRATVPALVDAVRGSLGSARDDVGGSARDDGVEGP